MNRFNIWLASRNKREVGVTVCGGRYLQPRVYQKMNEGKAKDSCRLPARTNHENVGTADVRGIGFRLCMLWKKVLQKPDALCVWRKDAGGHEMRGT